MGETYTVVCELNGASHSFSCAADQTVLAAAEAAGVPVPSSCCSGVCTTCAAVVKEGSVHQPDAMGVKAELQEQGFALLCVAFPRSDLKVVAGQEDALYEAQFGQYQKWARGSLVFAPWRSRSSVNPARCFPRSRLRSGPTACPCAGRLPRPPACPMAGAS